MKTKDICQQYKMSVPTLIAITRKLAGPEATIRTRRTTLMERLAMVTKKVMSIDNEVYNVIDTLYTQFGVAQEHVKSNK